jgi:hypothetical protein
VTSIYAILRPVYLFGTLYLFGSSWSSGVWLDRDSIAIIYFLYFYLIGAGVMPNLTITAVAPLCAHSLRRRLILLITTTLLFSN